MSRDTSALGGLETSDEQFAISLVQFAIPGFQTGTDIWGASPVINHGGGYSIGASSIVVSGLGSGTVPSGAMFSIGGNWYTVQSNATITSGGATLSISPLIAAVANGAALFTLLLNIHDVEPVVYLNPSTGAVSMATGAGLVPFSAYSGLDVPKIEETDSDILGDVTFNVSNVRGDWSAICAANQYRETIVTIWQGNLVQTAGVAPEAITFQGVVKRYAGRLEDIQPGRDLAQITLGPHIRPFTVTWPYRTYSQPGFKHLPPQGLSLLFGTTVVNL